MKFDCLSRSTKGLVVALAVLLSASVQAQGGEGHRHPPLLRPPLITVQPEPQARLPVRVEALDIKASIDGLVARTRMEITFYNPNARVLEGELQFPLLAGQSVSGFALDIGGRLRPAVAVPKAQGRQVFDDVTRQQVDPALLQQSRGNAYTLRIYPLPARGSRRVVLELTEILRAGDPRAAGIPQASYRLPLQFAERIGKLSIELSLTGRHKTVFATLKRRALRPELKPNGEAVVRYTTSNFEAGDLLEVRLTDLRAFTVTSTEEFRGKTYAYAELPMPQAKLPRQAPRTLGLVWDGSWSGARRDHAKELRLLDRYFRHLGDVTVQLKIVRDHAEPVQTFDVRGANWQALRETIERIVYDGATHVSAMEGPAGSDLVLLASDGLGNYGSASWAASPVPVMALVSGPVTDLDGLRLHAERSGGELIDLSRHEVPAALERLTHRRVRLAKLEGEGIADLVAGPRYGEDGRVRMAGVMQAPSGVIRATFEHPDGRLEVKSLPLSHGDGSRRSAGLGVAAQQWARWKAGELEANVLRHSAALERLGMHFGLVTSRTSLIVLDAAADYARHGIAPPASDTVLSAEVERLTAQNTARQQRMAHTQLALVTKAFNERVKWWEREFPKDDGPKPQSTMERNAFDEARGEPLTAGNAPRALRERTAPMAMALAPQATAASADLGSLPRADGNGQSGRIGIALKKWQPDSRYARRMRVASPEDVYVIYLDERPAYENSTAFFLDSADILLEKQQPVLAARVVSNLAEMKLEDRHILRILAYRLLQMRQAELALPLFKQVLALAPDEPQSWRDLGLAQAEAGQTQDAVQSLWHVVSHPWHDRFPGIELVALTELNALVARARRRGEIVDTSLVPPELQRNLPVAMRTVLTWDADNTDIDLWVTDPNGERVYYGHRLSYQGGLMSRDFTGGYGPEEFSLRAPKPGRYKVQAQFYGHRQQIVAPATTLMLQFMTNFGSDQERSQPVILRLSGLRDVVEIGDFEVVESAPAAAH